MKNKKKYKRNLPHIQINNATLFVTFRLAGSLPKPVIEKLKQEDEHRRKRLDNIEDPEKLKQETYLEHKRKFGRWDTVLDKADYGPRWLEQDNIAKITAGSMHFFDQQKYTLICYCIMPNHVHAVFTPLKKDDGSYYELRNIMHSLKSYTASEANKMLDRTGKFWQDESYDHVVRDELELNRIIRYVIYNPVKAGLVERLKDWKWSYLR